MINPIWIRTFKALAECRSFTAAADRLRLTQAAVSQHVRQLEDRLGPLVIRRPRRMDLTPAGKALLDYAQEMEAADRRLRDRLADTDGTVGDVSLITPGSVGLLLYPLLLDLQQSYPGLVVRHRFAPNHEVVDAVLQSQYELGLATARPDDPRLAARPFLEEPLELVVPAAARATDWQDLMQLGFIDHPDGQGMASRLLSRRFPGTAGFRSLPVRGFTNQVGLILEPVARGLGFTVLPRYARRAFGRQEAVRVLEDDPVVMDTLWLIHRAEWPPSARALRVVAHIEEQRAMGGHPGDAPGGREPG